MKSVGERIRQARAARGLSAEELAKLVGYRTQSGIANLENRETGTGGTKLPQIAEALRVPLQWLMNGPDSDNVPSVYDQPAQVVHAVHEEVPRYLDAWPFASFTQAEFCELSSDLQANVEGYIYGLLCAHRQHTRKHSP